MIADLEEVDLFNALRVRRRRLGDEPQDGDGGWKSKWSVHGVVSALLGFYRLILEQRRMGSNSAEPNESNGQCDFNAILAIIGIVSSRATLDALIAVHGSCVIRRLLSETWPSLASRARAPVGD